MSLISGEYDTKCVFVIHNGVKCDDETVVVFNDWKITHFTMKHQYTFDLYSSRSMTYKQMNVHTKCADSNVQRFNYEPVNDNNTNNFLTNHSVWFYSLYKKFMNIIEEVDILKKILLFNEKLPPSISI